MKKKFILPRRLFAFALAFALTFTSFSPLSVYAEGDEEQVQQTATEEEHCDDCCECHEGENSANLGEINPPAVENPTPTEVPVVITEIPQNPEPVNDGQLVLQDDVIQTMDTDSFALFAMPLMSTAANGGKNPESCNHPKGQTITTTIQPDCITAGYVEVYCQKCESVVSHDVLPATDKHSYDNGVVTTDPTCTEKGVKTFTCKVCNSTKTEDVNPTGHVSVEVPAKATSCTEEGMTAGHKCSVCDTILDGCQPIPMTEHFLISMTNIPASCMMEGQKGGKMCLNCNQIIVQPTTVPKTDHDYTDTVFNKPVVVPPTCTEQGYTKHFCRYCRDAFITDTFVEPSHNYVDVDEVKPTCTEDGHKAGIKCSVCGDILSGCEVLEMTGHDFEVTEQSDPICGKEDGRIKYECTKCEYYYDELIEAKLEHDFEDILEKKATCTEDGCSAYQKCKNCGYIPVPPTMTPALGGEHTFTLDKVLKEATCKEEGEGEYKCSKCGFVKTGVIPKKDHVYGKEYFFIITPATCGEDGSEDVYKDCEICGSKCEVEKGRVIPKTGKHDLNEKVLVPGSNCTEVSKWVQECKNCSYKKSTDCEEDGKKVYGPHKLEFDRVKKAATCTEDGIEVWHCKYCAYTEERNIPATGEHTWGTYEPDGNANCQSVGTKTAHCTCPGCSATDTIPGDAFGEHSWNSDYTVDKEATCAEEGSKSIHCKLCDETTSVTPIDKLEHTLEWVTIKEATCTEDGLRKQVCQNDGCSYESEPEIVKAKGHQFGEWYVDTEATCQNTGLKRRDCAKCSYYETEVIPKEKNHKYEIFVEKVEPTCTEEGYQTYKCKWCGKTRNQHKVDPLGHSFTEVKEVVEPTCTKDGYTVYKCSRCEETEVRDTVTKLGHKYGEWKITKEPTCKDLGSKRRDCIHEGCNSYQTQAMPVVNHSFTEVKEVVEPTCLEKGYTVYKCKWCEETEIRDYVDALDHDFEEEWQVETPATCTKNGTQIKHCKRPGCKWVQREVIFKTGHTYEEEWKVIKEPTCQELGVKARYCKNEGCNNYLSSAINKVGHSFTVPQKTVKPTCTEQGYTVYKCKWCEETEIRDYVDPLNHDYDDWFTVTDPTCQADGEERHDCKNCEAYETRPIAKLDHHVFSEFVKKVEPTCTVDGYTTYKCTWCDETEDRDTVAAKGHDFDDWYTVTDPTCQIEGESRRDCKNCEHFETKPIEKADHAYNKFVKAVAPTCESKGYSVYKCQWCEKTETRDYVDALGHKHVTDPGKSATCTSDGYTEKEYCSRCGRVFDDSDIIKATGHNWGPETFENFVFPTTISLGGYDSVRYCWNCGCKHSVHVTLPMISFVPTTPVKPLPKPITPVVPKPSPIVPKDDPFDIIDRSDENDPGEVKENAEDVKDVEDISDNADDSSKSEEVTGDESKDTSEIEVLDGNDNQKEIKTPDPKRRDENIVIDFSMYLIIGAIILLLILLTIFFIILAKRRKDSDEEEELK